MLLNLSSKDINGKNKPIQNKNRVLHLPVLTYTQGIIPLLDSKEYTFKPITMTKCLVSTVVTFQR